MRAKHIPTLARLVLLLAAATACTDHNHLNDPDPTTSATGLPVDFSSIRIASSATTAGGSAGSVPETDAGRFYSGDIIRARLTHNGVTQEARLTNISTYPPDWHASNPIYWQSTDPDTKQTLTLSRGPEGDFTLPDDMNETSRVHVPEIVLDVKSYALHDRLFHSYTGPMPANPTPTWTLQHRMAQIVVTLTRDPYSTAPTEDDLIRAQVSMTLPAEGHFDATTGIVSRRNAGAGGSAAHAKPVKFLRGNPQAGVHPRFAVALPGSTDTRRITITIPAAASSTAAAQTYQYTAPADITLEAGRSHVFRLSLGNRVSALSITTTQWQEAEQGPGVKEALVIEGVQQGGLKDLLPSTAGAGYGYVRVSGELNNIDYDYLRNFLNSLPAPVSLEIEITGGGRIIPFNALNGCTKLGAVVLKGIKEIYQDAFRSSSLTSISLPEELTTIDTNSFTGCKNLKSITLPSSVTYLGHIAFAGCTSLASVILSENLKTIGGNVFSDCTSLTSISIPSSVTTWGTGIFANSGLTSIALPEGMTAIPANTFERCANLQTITLPSTITDIGDYAFRNSGLTSIILPMKTQTIGVKAFANCTKLKKVAVYDYMKVSQDAFADTPDDKELFYYMKTPLSISDFGTTWKAIHSHYKGTGDLLDPNNYNAHY